MSSKKNLRQTLLQVSSNLDFSKCESLADEFKVVKKAYLRKALKTHPGTLKTFASINSTFNKHTRSLTKLLHIQTKVDRPSNFERSWRLTRFSGYVQERKSNEFF